MQDHFRLLQKLSDQVPRWEVAGVDDASRDRTPEILRILSEREPRLQLVRHETNQGIFAAFARCYQRARGDLVSKSPFFEAERIVRASREGYRVDFVPIRFAARTGGKATGGSWKNIRDSLRDLPRCLVVYGVRRR